MGAHTEEELRSRFAELDARGCGRVDGAAYMRLSLHGALSSSSTMRRVLDLFHEWDTDGDGQVSKREFRRAVQSFGWDYSAGHIDGVFAEIDVDGSGGVSYTELKQRLRPSTVCLNRHPLRRNRNQSARAPFRP